MLEGTSARRPCARNILRPAHTAAQVQGTSARRPCAHNILRPAHTAAQVQGASARRPCAHNILRPGRTAAQMQGTSARRPTARNVLRPGYTAAQCKVPPLAEPVLTTYCAHTARAAIARKHACTLAIERSCKRSRLAVPSSRPCSAACPCSHAQTYPGSIQSCVSLPQPH